MFTTHTQIKGGDPEDSKHCVRLMDNFEHTGPHGKHVCMVFEVRMCVSVQLRVCVCAGWGGVGWGVHGV